MYFTYLLGWTSQKKYYYGVRYKEQVTLDTVGTTYFSSSKYVKDHIEIFGRPDVVYIRRTFSNKLDAKRWEEKVIRRMGCVKSEMWLNKGNNNSFKDIVMTTEIAASISEAKKTKNKNKPKIILYNNGVVTKGFREGQEIPAGFVKGKIVSDKQKQWLKQHNENMTADQRKQAGKKTSLTTKGVKKPDGFGDKISRAQLGGSKPWNMGDLNPSKREESRKKISDSHKGRKHFTDGKALIFVKPECAPEGYWPCSVYHFKKSYETKQ